LGKEIERGKRKREETETEISTAAEDNLSQR